MAVITPQLKIPSSLCSLVAMSLPSPDEDFPQAIPSTEMVTATATTPSDLETRISITHYQMYIQHLWVMKYTRDSIMAEPIWMHKGSNKRKRGFRDIGGHHANIYGTTRNSRITDWAPPLDRGMIRFSTRY